MTRFFTWIATTGLIAILPLASAPAALAQALPPNASDIPAAAPESSAEDALAEDTLEDPPSAVTTAVTNFLIDYVPNNCTVQLGYFEGDDFAVVGTQSVETLLADNPLVPCNSVTGSDNGNTKNFNFISDDSAVYKIITASEPVNASSDANDFTVLAIQIIPIDDEGAPNAEDTIQLSFIDEGTCEVDSVEAPQAVVCEFTSLSDTPSAAMGRLSYSW